MNGVLSLPQFEPGAWSSLFGDPVVVIIVFLIVVLLSIVAVRALRRRQVARRATVAHAQALTTQVQQFEAALGHVGHGVCLYDADSRLIYASPRFYAIYDLPPDSLRPGTTFDQVVRQGIAAGLFPNRAPEAVLWDRLTFAARREYGTVLHERDDRAVLITHVPTADGGWAATYDDITARRQADQRIVHLARHDALTNLPNRSHFLERLGWALAQVARGGQLAVHYVDVDRFKVVNDTYGHAHGDALLQTVAARLRHCARATDTVARLGSDTFAIVQVGIDRPESAVVLAQRVLRSLAEPYDLLGTTLTVSAAVGIAIAPIDGVEGGPLLAYAEQAMLRAKADGPGTVRLFEAEMDARMRARRALEMDMRGALARGEFELRYQPLVNVATRRICAFEALVRWRHPLRGFVPPVEFIPIAEDTGMIVALGEWVLRQACTDAARWPEDIRVAVNMSPVQLRQSTVLDTIRLVLAQSGLPAPRLELEVTETLLLEINDQTRELLQGLHRMGLRIAIDDFGTGYASLSYLRDFPFDKIKIDRSFVEDFLERPECLAIVRAMLRLANSLGITAVAEGVRTAEQVARLRAEGCTEIQSFLLGPPQPASDIPRLLGQQESLEALVA